MYGRTVLRLLFASIVKEKMNELIGISDVHRSKTGLDRKLRKIWSRGLNLKLRKMKTGDHTKINLVLRSIEHNEIFGTWPWPDQLKSKMLHTSSIVLSTSKTIIVDESGTIWSSIREWLQSSPLLLQWLKTN